MKFHEVMDKLLSGTPVYCGSNKYTVENKMLHRNGNPTFTIDYFDIASDKWSLEEDNKVMTIPQIKVAIEELSEKEFSDVFGFLDNAGKILSKGKGIDFDYVRTMHSSYVETPDDMICLMCDCLAYNCNNSDKLVDYKIVTLSNPEHCIVVYMFYKKGD